MSHCGTCGRRKDQHNVRHPFKEWAPGQRSSVVPDDAAHGLCERELEPMGSE